MELFNEEKNEVVLMELRFSAEDEEVLYSGTGEHLLFSRPSHCRLLVFHAHSAQTFSSILHDHAWCTIANLNAKEQLGLELN